MIYLKILKEERLNHLLFNLNTSDSWHLLTYSLTIFYLFLAASFPLFQSSPLANANSKASSLKQQLVIAIGALVDDLYLALVSLFQTMNVPSLPTVEKVPNFLLKEMLFTV